MNRTEPVVLQAVARLVLGEKRHALALVSSVVPGEPPRPPQASTLWLTVLLQEGPPLDGLDELQRLLGHPDIEIKDRSPRRAAEVRTNTSPNSAREDGECVW